MALQTIRVESMAFAIPLADVAGGRAVRWFDMDGKKVRPGTEFTREQILAMGPINRSALLGRFIAVWPRSSSAGNASSLPDNGSGPAERHVVSLGFGHFKVIEGKVLAEDVARDEAYALAGKTAQKLKGQKES